MRLRAAFFYASAECGISARFFVIIYIMVHSKRILAFCITGGIFTLIAGTLGHFVYEWSGGAVWTAWLFPVNESVWEHLKLLILPAVVFFALGAYFMRGANNYISGIKPFNIRKRKSCASENEINFYKRICKKMFLYSSRFCFSFGRGKDITRQGYYKFSRIIG